MNRRKFLGTTATIGVTAIAGCSGDSSGDSGNSVVSETVYAGDDQEYNFDVESGQTISVYINHIEGSQTVVQLYDPNDDRAEVFSEDTESTSTHEAETSGTYSAIITTLGEAEVEITLED